MAQEWASRLYKSQAWIDLRRAIIAERGMHCEKCGRLLHNPADITADHIVELTPDNVTDPKVALNPDNVQLLCADCHNRKHQRFGHNQKRVYIVYGSPCSGKTTLVNRLKLRGDVILDMDTLYQALSGCRLYDKPDNIVSVVFRARDAVLDAVKTRLGQWNNAYIVGGYPARAKREALQRQLGAELIYCDSTEAECLMRAETRGIFAADWKKYVCKWWAEYEP